MKRILMLFLATSSFAIDGVFHPITAERVIENRHGRTSVWGLILHVEPPLAGPLTAPDLKIIEDKHHRNLFRFMDVKLDDDGRTVTIMFKPGKGDFGSGNTVNIIIKEGVRLRDGTVNPRVASVRLSTDIPPNDSK